MNSFWNDILPNDYYDSILKEGIQMGKGIQANWHNLTFLKVKSSLVKKGKHLDYACGPGSFIGNYLSLTSIGVDISYNQISYAKNNYNKFGEFYTLEEFNYDKYEKYFDYITVIGLLEYLNEDETVALLDKLYLILKENGKIILTTPNYQIPMAFLEKLSHILGPIDYSSQHQSKYKFNKLNNVLSKSKFRNITIKKFMNYGVFFSFFSLKLGSKIVNKIDSLLQNKFGLLFFIELKK